MRCPLFCTAGNAHRGWCGCLGGMLWIYLPHGSDNCREPVAHAQCLSDGKRRPLSLFLSLSVFVITTMFLSVSTRGAICWYPSHSTFPSVSTFLLFLFFCCAYPSILPLCSSLHPPSLASAFYRQPRRSAMPFGCSVLHFPYVTLWQVTVQWLQDLLSKNDMLMIILLFKVRGKNLVLLEVLVIGWQVCVGLCWGIQPSIIQLLEGMDLVFAATWESVWDSVIYFRVRGGYVFICSVSQCYSIRLIDVVWGHIMTHISGFWFYLMFRL